MVSTIPSWLSHANEACRIRTVTLVVVEPNALVTSYEQLFATVARPALDGFEIDTVRGHFRFATRAALSAAYPDDFPKLKHPASTMAVVRIEIRDLARAESCLNKSGAVTKRGHDLIQVSRTASCGIILEFVESSSIHKRPF